LHEEEVRGVNLASGLDDELRRHLERGEKLLWAGRPAQGIVFATMDWYYIPFSVVWLGFVLQIFGQRNQVDAVTGLTSVLFVAVGIYMLIGRFIVDWIYRSGVVYGVTDRRAIIVSGLASRSVQSIDFSSLSGLKLEERGDGSGTIAFGDQPPYWYRQQLHAAWGAGAQFFRVPEVRKVYSIVYEAMQRQKRRG